MGITRTTEGMQSMAKRMNMSVPRKKKDGGTYWVNIGTAWIEDNGQAQLVFDALPIPDEEGRCVARLFEPRDRDGGQQQSRQAAPPRDDLDDDFPPF